jgi:urease accessory protein
MDRKLLPSLRLFQLISPALPIGAFTYSQGMEWAVENGWIENESDLEAWLRSVLHDNIEYLEAPVIARLYQALEQQSEERFSYWSSFLLASRETSELRTEEQQRARALHTLLAKLPDAEGWAELQSWREALLRSQSSGFSLAGYYWHIDVHSLLHGYVWSWLENAVTVAVKLVPLGQTEGQRLLYRLSEIISPVIERALDVKDEQLGASTPALAIASSLHETQYTRLFRS